MDEDSSSSDGGSADSEPLPLLEPLPVLAGDFGASHIRPELRREWIHHAHVGLLVTWPGQMNPMRFTNFVPNLEMRYATTRAADIWARQMLSLIHI